MPFEWFNWCAITNWLPMLSATGLYYICDWICENQSKSHKKLKSILLLNIKPLLLHYLETPNKWLYIDDHVCFHRRPLPSLSNCQDALQGLWGQWMSFIRMWVVPECYQFWLSRTILWIEYVSVTDWTHSNAVCVLMEGITPSSYSPTPILSTYLLPITCHLWYYTCCEKVA